MSKDILKIGDEIFVKKNQGIFDRDICCKTGVYCGIIIVCLNPVPAKWIRGTSCKIEFYRGIRSDE